MKRLVLAVVSMAFAVAGMALTVEVADGVMTIHVPEDGELRSSDLSGALDDSVTTIAKTGAGTLYNTNSVLETFTGTIEVREGRLQVATRKDLGTNGTGGANDRTIVKSGAGLTLAVASTLPADHEFGDGTTAETIVIAGEGAGDGDGALWVSSSVKEVANEKEASENQVRNLNIVLSGHATLKVNNGYLYPQHNKTNVVAEGGGIDFGTFTLTKKGNGTLVFSGMMKTGEGAGLVLDGTSALLFNPVKCDFAAGAKLLTIDVPGSTKRGDLNSNDSLKSQYMFKDQVAIPEKFKDLICVRFDNYSVFRLWQVKPKDNVHKPETRFVPLYGDIVNNADLLRLLVVSAPTVTDASGKTDYYTFDVMWQGHLSGSGNLYFSTVDHWINAKVYKGGVLNLMNANTMTGMVSVETNNILNVGHAQAVETFGGIYLTNAVMTVGTNVVDEVQVPKVTVWNDQDFVTVRVPTNLVTVTDAEKEKKKYYWYMYNKFYPAGIVNEGDAVVKVAGLEKSGSGMMDLSRRMLSYNKDAPTHGVGFTDVVEVKEGVLKLDNGFPGWRESVTYGIDRSCISGNKVLVESLRKHVNMTNACVLPRALYGRSFAEEYVGSSGYTYHSKSGRSLLLEHENTLVAYDGWMNNRSEEPKTWRFVTFHRTRARVYVDGVEIIYQDGQSTIGFAEVTLTPGWHFVEFFGHNDTGSPNGGPSPWMDLNRNPSLADMANDWWTDCLNGKDFRPEVTKNNFSFAYDPSGKYLDKSARMTDPVQGEISAYSNHVTFVALKDPGDGSLVRSDITTWEKPGTSIPKLWVHAGARVDMNGAVYRMEEVRNDGTIENGNLIVDGKVTVSAGKPFALDGKVVLENGATIDVVGEVSTRTDHELVAATGGVEVKGELNLTGVDERWSIKVEGGKVLMKTPRGTVMILR